MKWVTHGHWVQPVVFRTLDFTVLNECSVIAPPQIWHTVLRNRWTAPISSRPCRNSPRGLKKSLQLSGVAKPNCKGAWSNEESNYHCTWHGPNASLGVDFFDSCLDVWLLHHPTFDPLTATHSVYKPWKFNLVGEFSTGTSYKCVSGFKSWTLSNVGDGTIIALTKLSYAAGELHQGQ